MCGNLFPMFAYIISKVRPPSSLCFCLAEFTDWRLVLVGNRGRGAGPGGSWWVLEGPGGSVYQPVSHGPQSGTAGCGEQ